MVKLQFIIIIINKNNTREDEEPWAELFYKSFSITNRFTNKEYSLGFSNVFRGVHGNSVAIKTLIKMYLSVYRRVYF